MIMTAQDRDQHNFLMLLLLAGVLLSAGLVLLRGVGPARKSVATDYSAPAAEASSADLMGELNATADDGGEADFRQLENEFKGL